MRSRTGERWKIPQADVDGNRTSWEETDPLKLGELTTDQNEAAQVVDDRHAYVPTVKLIRQVRKHHLEERKPGGLYFELETYWAFDPGIAGDSWAEVLTETLEHIADQLESGDGHHGPGDGGGLLADAGGRGYRPCGGESSGAWRRTPVARSTKRKKCPAAAIWRRILGKNERSWVFVIPEGCDEEGRRRSRSAAVKDRGPREAAPFA